MNSYLNLDLTQRQKALKELMSLYNEYKSQELSLDLSRGKPNSTQLDESQELLSVPLTREECFSESGLDCRNYGLVDGVPEVKKLLSDIYNIDPKKIIVGGNSSLQLMYDTLMRAMLFGFADSERAWCKEEKIKWICLVPGYDRHFKITETLGFEMISVKISKTGPDMDEVERLVKDPAVKGIWCVPKYSNPTGITFDEQTVRRLVSMKCAAPDFKIFWDNAYAIHDFNENGDELVNIFDVAGEYGTEDRVMYFSSTSKVTFAGSGISFMAASLANIAKILPHVSVQTIGFDKINQLRHLKFLKNKENVRSHMLKLGALTYRKFDIALKGLEKLEGLGIANWTKPNGGYFISLDVMPGTAKRVYNLMKEAGVTLTGVGATFPYGIDPEDSNLRIAPTYPSDADLKLAIDILVLTVKIAALEKLA